MNKTPISSSELKNNSNNASHRRLQIQLSKKFSISKAEFVRQLAYFKCELIALRPFYELNGRITRLFFDMIVRHNNYRYIDYSGIPTETYISASIGEFRIFIKTGAGSIMPHSGPAAKAIAAR